jgi:quercetin dioxygenase-like cupin family protein
MRNFLQIAAGLDVTPILHALALNPDLWNENDLRTKHPGTAHAEADDIWVFFNQIPTDPAEVINDIAVQPYRAWEVLTPLRPMVLDLMRRVDGIQLGRVLVTRLAPGARITPHTDMGAPAEYFTRYQIALQSLPGAIFRVEDETANFRSGDAWWFNNQLEHEVVNNSADDRIVCIIDVRHAC